MYYVQDIQTFFGGSHKCLWKYNNHFMIHNDKKIENRYTDRIHWINDINSMAIQRHKHFFRILNAVGFGQRTEIVYINIKRLLKSFWFYKRGHFHCTWNNINAISFHCTIITNETFCLSFILHSSVNYSELFKLDFNFFFTIYNSTPSIFYA